MLVDANLPEAAADIATVAAQFEAAGFDGLWVTETNHDPFLVSLQASQGTRRMSIGTGVAIAFARTPMTVAYSAWDLAEHSNGRFILGLGSQIRPHIERRFSMPWSHPAPRMREFVLALRAIWGSWSDGQPLSFDGEFYRHTLMTPFFTPVQHQWSAPPVYLAAVGERMTEVAGEVADALIFHALTTPRYLREVSIPALRRGRQARQDDSSDDTQIAGLAFTCTGRDERELADAVKHTKAQLAFYASTPAYRAVLELHGWGDLALELTKLTKEGRWDELGDVIDDDVLTTFAAVGEPATAGRILAERWGPVANRIGLYTPYDCHVTALEAVVSELKSAPTPLPA